MAEQKTPAQLLLEAAQRAAQVRRAAADAAQLVYAERQAPAPSPPAPARTP